MFVFQLSHFIREFIYLFSLSSPLDAQFSLASLSRASDMVLQSFHHPLHTFWLKPLWHGDWRRATGP